jgi:hypothetical protein
MHGLLTDDVLRKYDNLVLERLWTTSTNYSIDVTNAAYGRAFLRVLLFGEWQDLIADLHLSGCVLYYNRYLWARRFAKAYQSVHGPDAGIEQEIFRLLEQAPSDADWTILASIDRGVGE